jgi:hypothetical protein
MSRGSFSLRPTRYPEILGSDDFEASSSIAPSSSPEFPLPSFNFPPGPFRDIEFTEDDDQDSPHVSSEERRGRTTDNEKATVILQFMKTRYPRFSLRMFLDAIFADGASKEVKGFSSSFMKDSGLVKLMDILFDLGGLKDTDMSKWVVSKAAEVCAREASRLTDRASRSGQTEDAYSFRVNSKRITVKMIESFRMPDLTKRYAKVSPYLQCILRAVIGKEGKPDGEGSRNPDDVRQLTGINQ